MEIVVRIEKVKEIEGEDFPLPQYAHPFDAGVDLRSRVDITIPPGERRLVPTGIKIAIPPGYAGIIKDRSGLALREGLHTLAGVIDSGYRGEVGVILLNSGKEEVKIKKGERIAQLLVIPCMVVKWEEGDLEETARGEKGWGSTGKK
ncbi:dUTP diphosphatase [Candidatus Calescamantes bacterium]|nr:dUTP diphosphatase [Candidatus Calescamantes bacterium]